MWQMKIIPEAKMRDIFYVYPNVDRLPFHHVRTRLIFEPQVLEVEEETPRSPQSIGSPINSYSPQPFSLDGYDEPPSPSFLAQISSPVSQEPQPS